MQERLPRQGGSNEVIKGSAARRCSGAANTTGEIYGPIRYHLMHL